MDDDSLQSENAPFPAKITAKTDSSGTWLYDWTEQSQDIDGEYLDADPARTGDPDDSTAYELNNLEIDVPCFVSMRYKGVVGGQNAYEFAAPADSLSAGPLTVEAVDGTPSYTGIHTIRGDELDGIVITNPATGVARIDLAAASQGQRGIVDLEDGQSLGAGVKRFTPVNVSLVSEVVSRPNPDGGYGAPNIEVHDYPFSAIMFAGGDAAYPGFLTQISSSPIRKVGFLFDLSATPLVLLHASSSVLTTSPAFENNQNPKLYVATYGIHRVGEGFVDGVDVTEAGVTYTGGLRVSGTLAVPGSSIDGPLDFGS